MLFHSLWADQLKTFIAASVIANILVYKKNTWSSETSLDQVVTIIISRRMLQSPKFYLGNWVFLMSVFSITVTHCPMQGVIKRAWQQLCTACKTQNLCLYRWIQYCRLYDSQVHGWVSSSWPASEDELKKAFFNSWWVDTLRKNLFFCLAQTHVQDQVADLFDSIFRLLIYWRVAYSSYLHRST